MRIFLAHAAEDKPQVRQLYKQLEDQGYRPWLDEKDLLPGQNWKIEIPKAINECELFCACLSKCSIRKEGYIQKEFRLALNAYSEKPPGSIYLIPLKFDDCEVPDLQIPELSIRLSDIHWVDYWKSDGLELITKSIKKATNHKANYEQNSIERREDTPPKDIGNCDDEKDEVIKAPAHFAFAQRRNVLLSGLFFSLAILLVALYDISINQNDTEIELHLTSLRLEAKSIKSDLSELNQNFKAKELHEINEGWSYNPNEAFVEPFINKLLTDSIAKKKINPKTKEELENYIASSKYTVREVIGIFNELVEQLK